MESYKKQKPNRHLEWRWALGQATMELEIDGKITEYTVPSTLAIVLLPFHNRGMARRMRAMAIGNFWSKRPFGRRSVRAYHATSQSN
jgi:hypothetical protein